MIDGQQLTVIPDAAGHWEVLTDCTRCSHSKTHIVFYSESNIVCLSISSLMHALTRRVHLDIELEYRSRSILNAQIVSNYLLVVSYTSQLPFLTVYNLATGTCSYSPSIQATIFTTKSYVSCASTPGILGMLGDTVIFSFSRDSPVFACELTRIDSLENYLKLGHCGACFVDDVRQELLLIENTTLYTYKENNLMQPVAMADIRMYKLGSTTVRNTISSPFSVEECGRFCEAWDEDESSGIIVTLSNRLRLALDITHKSAILLSTAPSPESIKSDLRSPTEQVHFHFSTFGTGQPVLHNLYFSAKQPVSSIFSVATYLALARFGAHSASTALSATLVDTHTRAHKYLLSGTINSQHHLALDHYPSKHIVIEMLQRALADSDLAEAIEACRTEYAQKQSITVHRTRLLCIIYSLSQRGLYERGISALDAAQIEERVRKHLHEYAMRKVKQSRSAHRATAHKHSRYSHRNSIYIGTEGTNAATTITKKQQTTSQYLHLPVCTHAEMKLLRDTTFKVSQQCCGGTSYVARHFTCVTSQWTHLLTDAPIAGYDIADMCAVVTTKSATLAVVICQSDLYVYII